MERTSQPRQASRGSIATGVGVTFGLHVGVQLILLVAFLVFVPKGDGGPLILLMPAETYVAGTPLWWIGLTQLIYVIPATIVALRRDRPVTAAGIWVAAGITAIANLAWIAALS